MQKIVVLGGVAFNTLIYVDNLPQPVPQTVFSQRFHETVGSTGPGRRSICIRHYPIEKCLQFGAIVS